MVGAWPVEKRHEIMTTKDRPAVLGESLKQWYQLLNKLRSLRMTTCLGKNEDHSNILPGKLTSINFTYIT